MSLTIESAAVVASLNALAAWNKVAWLEAIGKQQSQRIQDRIRKTKVDPEGTPWAPWRPRTLEWRQKKGNVEQGLLWDTGELLNSVSVAVSGESVEIGVTAEHGHFLQEGTVNMVARPFVGWSDSDSAGVEASLVAHLNALL